MTVPPRIRTFARLFCGVPPKIISGNPILRRNQPSRRGIHPSTFLEGAVKWPDLRSISEYGHLIQPNLSLLPSALLDRPDSESVPGGGRSAIQQR